MVAEARARLSLDGKPFSDTLTNSSQEAESKLGKSMDNVGKMIKQAFTVGAVVQFAQKIMSTADETDNLSKRLSLQAETTQSLGVVFKEAGLGMGDLENAMLKVNKNALEATTGNAKMTESFAKLGITMDDLKTMSPEQTFEAVTKAMAQNQDNADVLTSAYDVLGDKAGPKLKSVLIDVGTQGFDSLNKKMLESGEIMSNKTISDWDKLNDQIAKSGRQLQSFVGEYGSKFISWLEDSGDAFGVWLSGADPEMVKETQKAMEELRKTTEEAAQAELKHREAIAEQIEKDLARREKIASLEKEIGELSKVQLSPAKELNDAKENLKRLEVELLKLNDATGDVYLQQLEIQKDIIVAKDDIAKKEKELAKLNEDNLKRELELIDKLESARARYYEDQADAQWAQFTTAQKLTVLQDRLNNLKVFQSRLDMTIADDALQYVQASDDIKKTQEEINALKGKDGEITTDQIEKLNELRDVFKGMTEKEINSFIKGLQDLAIKLNNLPKVAGIDWLKDIGSFSLPRQFTSSKAKALGNAIVGFIEELNRTTKGVKPDLSFLKDLEVLGDLKLPANFTSGKADDVSRAISALLNGLKGLQGFDFAKLKMALELIDQLNNLGQGGKWELEVKVPDGFEGGIPLIIPEGLTGSLQDLAVSAKTLAGMKGVIWA